MTDVTVGDWVLYRECGVMTETLTAGRVEKVSPRTVEVRGWRGGRLSGYTDRKRPDSIVGAYRGPDGEGFAQRAGNAVQARQAAFREAEEQCRAALLALIA